MMPNPTAFKHSSLHRVASRSHLGEHRAVISKVFECLVTQAQLPACDTPIGVSQAVSPRNL